MPTLPTTVPDATSAPYALDGRVCLVTGAAQGIGAAIASALADAGGCVLVTDRDLRAAQRTADAIRQRGGKAEAWMLDVTDEAGWEAAVSQAVHRFGGLDVLVNNAGLFLARSILDTSLADLRGVLAVNVEGVFLGIQAAIPHLCDPVRRARATASIINLSSVAGLVGAAGCSAYSLSKGAVRLLTKSAALELAPRGIRVNSIHPGIVDTEMGQQAMAARAGGGSASVQRTVAEAAYPMGRLGRVEDVAHAALYLASEASSFTTGSELVLDGGLTAC